MPYIHGLCPLQMRVLVVHRVMILIWREYYEQVLSQQAGQWLLPKLKSIEREGALLSGTGKVTMGSRQMA